MRIVWDEPKRIANRDKLGFDFADLTEDFFAESLVTTAARGRFKAIGRFEDGTIAVVFFALGSEGLSVISMRPASRSERTMLR
jgi:uncharacterized DUF497 family protein